MKRLGMLCAVESMAFCCAITEVQAADVPQNFNGLSPGMYQNVGNILADISAHRGPDAVAQALDPTLATRAPQSAVVRDVPVAVPAAAVVVAMPTAISLD